MSIKEIPPSNPIAEAMRESLVKVEVTKYDIMELLDKYYDLKLMMLCDSGGGEREEWVKSLTMKDFIAAETLLKQDRRDKINEKDAYHKYNNDYVIARLLEQLVDAVRSI